MRIDDYVTQGPATDPGADKAFLTSLPEGIEGLCEGISALVAADFLAVSGLYELPSDSIADTSVRRIAEKLELLRARASWAEEEKAARRMMRGNCRDLSLFLCSALRQRGIPSRIRSGFATFFDPAKRFDHWVCETWSQEEDRWKCVDPWMAQIAAVIDRIPPAFAKGLKEAGLAPMDLGPAHFMAGAEAWLRCRRGGEEPSRYGTYEDGLDGLWFIRDNMIRDLFCLEMIEVLPWDCWGVMGKAKAHIAPEELAALDEAAFAASERDGRQSISRLADRFRSDGLPDSLVTGGSRA